MARRQSGSTDGFSQEESGSATNYHTHALTRGLTVLELVAARQEPLTLSELHEQSGLPKSTIVRLTRALTGDGYLVRVDERPAFRLGHKVLALSHGYLHTLNVAELVRHELAPLSVATAQTVNLGVLEGGQVLHLAVEMPPRPLRFDAAVGSRADTYCTGLGKVLLAGLPADEVAKNLPPEPWPPETPTRHTSAATLTPDLAAIAERGYALDENEFAVGLTCLAVPITEGDETVAALSISGPSGEFDEERVRKNLALMQASAQALAGDPEVVSAIRAAALRRG